MAQDEVARQMDCPYCKSRIPEGAKLCSVCRHYQAPSAWRNWAPHLGAGIALITFVFAVATYISGVLSGTYRQLTSRDGVAVAFLNSRGTTGYLNSGDHDVFLMDEDLRCTQFGLSIGRPLSKALPTSNLVTFEAASIQGWYLDDTMGDVEPLRVGTTDLMFFDTDNLELKDHLKNFPKLVVHPARGKVRYFSFRDGKPKTYEFDCVCIVVKNP